MTDKPLKVARVCEMGECLGDLQVVNIQSFQLQAFDGERIDKNMDDAERYCAGVNQAITEWAKPIEEALEYIADDEGFTELDEREYRLESHRKAIQARRHMRRDSMPSEGGPQ